MKLDFEVIEVKAKKTASNDTEYKLVLVTDNAVVLELSRYINEKILSVEIQEDKGYSDDKSDPS